MAIFTGQQGYIPRYNMEALTAPGRNIGAGLQNLAQSIERHQLAEEKKKQVEGARQGREDLLFEMTGDREKSSMLSKVPDVGDALDAVQIGMQRDQQLKDEQGYANLQASLAGNTPQPTAQFNPGQYLTQEPRFGVSEQYMQPQMYAQPTSPREIVAPVATTATPQMSREALMEHAKSIGQDKNPMVIEDAKQLKTDSQIAKYTIDQQTIAREDTRLSAEANIKEENDVLDQYVDSKISSGEADNWTTEQWTKNMLPLVKNNDLVIAKSKAMKEIGMFKNQLSPVDKVKYDKAVEELKQTKLNAGGMGALTEGEQKKILHVSRMEGANQVIKSIKGEDYDPSGIASTVYGILPDFAIVNWIKTEGSQMYDVGMASWTDSLLRFESGAAIPAPELLRYGRSYFPRGGDKEGTIDAKAFIRDRILIGMKAGIETRINKESMSESYWDVETGRRVTLKEVENRTKSIGLSKEEAFNKNSIVDNGKVQPNGQVSYENGSYIRPPQ